MKNDKFCPVCNGDGEHEHETIQGETYIGECSTCGGSGFEVNECFNCGAQEPLDADDRCQECAQREDMRDASVTKSHAEALGLDPSELTNA